VAAYKLHYDTVDL